MGLEDVANLGAFVQNADVRMLEVMGETELLRLHLKVLALHRTEQKQAPSALAAEIEELVEPGQRRDVILDLHKMPMKGGIQFRQGNVGKILLVEFGERQSELPPEFVAGQRRTSVFLEHEVGRADDRRHVVDERPRPIEQKIAQHGQLKNFTERILSAPNSAASFDSISAFHTRSSSKRTLDWCTRT